jgi:hypothetical protein
MAKDDGNSKNSVSQRYLPPRVDAISPPRVGVGIAFFNDFPLAG